MDAERTPRAMARSLLIALTLCTLAACGGGGKSDPGPVAVTRVTQRIGSAGGSIAGPGGVQLTIPPDALAADVDITIEVSDTGAPALPAGADLRAPVLALLPHRTTFSVPVSLTLPADAALAAGEVPQVLKTDPTRTGWQPLVVERDGDRLVTAITSFSNIGVMMLPPEQPPSIVLQPASCTVHEGDLCIFNVMAVGSRGSGPELRYEWRRNGQAVPGGADQLYLLPAAAWSQNGDLFSVVVTDGLGRTVTSTDALLTVQPNPPAVVNHPLDDYVVAGNAAVFSGALISSASQVLQWKRCDPPQACPADPAGWTNALGGTSATFVIGSPQAIDDGTRVALCATNVAGTSCTHAATLHVVPAPSAPVVLTSPQSVTATTGSSAGFTVTASGGFLHYAWESSAGSGPFLPETRCADSASCTLSNVSLGDDGLRLRVRVSNAVGSALSDPAATLTVRFRAGAAVVRVVGTRGASIGLQGDAQLVQWGALLPGAPAPGNQPSLPGGVGTMAASVDHVLAIRDDGSVWAWGSNQSGELGDGGSTERAAPQAVAGLEPMRSVTAGGSSSFAATAVDGRVWAWGANQQGQLGVGTTTSHSTPVPVGRVSGVVSMAAGASHVLARRSDGTVWVWGSNEYGQLGTGDTMARLEPTPIALSDIVAVATASVARTSVALRADGTVFTWGFGGDGALGDGSTASRSTPTAIALPAPAVAIAAGGFHVLALLADGRVMAWGYNRQGQAGVGILADVVPMPQAVVAPLPPDVVAIGAGPLHSLALDAAGNTWAWGGNASSQLGDGSTVDRLTPVQVQGVNLN